jgi:hypothetical protein
MRNLHITPTGPESPTEQLHDLNPEVGATRGTHEEHPSEQWDDHETEIPCGAREEKI